MSSKKILVVFGVTGNQGGSVVDAILSNSALSEQFQIRGITRDPTKPKAVSLIERGITLLKANLEDKGSLRAALKDAHTVFAVTNWQEILNKEKEIQQGKNIADVANELNIQHLIWSSLPNVTRITEGNITGVLHFDSKAVVEDYIRTLSIPATYLQLAVFMEQMALMLVPTSPNSHSYKLMMPAPTSTKVHLISAKHDVGKYVTSIILNRDQLVGKAILAGEREYSVQEIADILVKTGGIDVKAEEIGDEQYRGLLQVFGMPEFVADDMSQNMKYIQDYGFFGGDSVEQDHSILTEPLETFEEWVANSPEIAAMK